MARSIPSNQEAEQSLLSSMFISHNALEKATDTLTEEDFYFDNNRVLFSVLDKLNKKNIPIDMTSVVTELKDSNKLNIEKENSRLQDEKNTKEAKELVEKLKKITITFTAKAGNGDKMFGSISSKQIKEELDKIGYHFDKKQISCELINSFGFHNVEINLYKNINGIIKVEVRKG